MLVSVLVGAIRAEAAHGADPVAMLTSLNQRMMGRSRGGFTTCLVAHLTAGGKLTMANAGHLPPYLNGLEIAVPGALPLGVVAHAEYECATVQLVPGDRLTFVSDGAVSYTHLDVYKRQVLSLLPGLCAIACKASGTPSMFTASVNSAPLAVSTAGSISSWISLTSFTLR